MSIKINKEDVVCVWNTTQTLKNEILPFPTTWMDLEGIVLIEKIQRKIAAVAAAAAAKSLQSCPALCDPIDGSPPGSTVPGILQARIPEWAAISFSNA